MICIVINNSFDFRNEYSLRKGRVYKIAKSFGRFTIHYDE